MDSSLTVPGRYDHLEQIASFIAAAGQAAGLDEVAVCRCQLAVDEACTNIIEHGYEGEDRGQIELVCTPGEGELTITITDQAQRFSLEAVREPTLNASLEDMQIGGLGLYFMRQVMDTVEHSYEGGANRLVLVKRREPAAPPTQG
jgi:anti-sigma regulatory factor (Ser/Thr protein kinase)